MVRVEVSVHIDKPLAEVFAYMGDPTNVPEWDPMIERATPSALPIRVGATVRLRQRFLGRQIEPILEIVEHVPNSLITYVFDKPFKGKGTDRFEVEGDGTRVTQVFEVEPGGFFKLAEPIAGRIFQKQQQASLETLKEIVEARTPVGQPEPHSR